MKTSDIEKMLTPKYEFRAPDRLKKRIIESAEAEAFCETRKRFHWWKLATSLAAAAVIAVVAVVVKPGSAPLYAAESLFHRAAELFLHNDSFSATFDVRTKTEESFYYINMGKGFIEHRMSVMPQKGLWLLEKSGRMALRDGNYIWQWIPEEEFGWKFDSWELGVIEDFAFMLDPYSLLRNEEALARNNPNTVIKKSENDGIISLVVESPASGEFVESDYMRNSSIMESDTRREYTFEKSSGKLLSLKISAKAFGIRRTIVKMTDIDYTPSICMVDFTAPEQISWVDMTRAGLENAADTLPLDEFRNLTPEQAVGKMFAAMKDWDEELLNVVLYSTNRNRLEKTYRGCELLEIGEPFTSGLYAGTFVPCKVLLSDGRIKNLKIALRNDNFFGTWAFDGGM